MINSDKKEELETKRQATKSRLIDNDLNFTSCKKDSNFNL